MIWQHMELRVKPEQVAEFEAALCEVRQRLFSCAGFRGFSVLQSIELGSRYLVRVQWETEDELIAVNDAGHAERAWAPVMPLLIGQPRLDHFEERNSLGLNGPGVITDMSWMAD